eukprot:TRINITY_DN7026_c0_g1_i1.p2 TRINITY_DN7026_c0_g1~~TRINITY_DN7026_c0_g1_i1.p2  ORF type:complete len:73 (-),score=12.18 TRINITY_DN7026_c0_g1_i1:38-256(-)
MDDNNRIVPMKALFLFGSQEAQDFGELVKIRITDSDDDDIYLTMITFVCPTTIGAFYFLTLRKCLIRSLMTK